MWKCRFPVDNNMIDMRVTNKIVQRQQHASARYPKRPLQAEESGCLEDRELMIW